jgi:hypothetical protein
MDVVVLPLVNYSETVATALKQMRKAERSGIVRQNENDTQTLFYAGDLLRASAKKIAKLVDVPDGERVVMLDVGRARKFHLDIVRPHRTWKAYETWLAKEQAHYALLAGTSNTAMIVTSSENETEDLSMSGGYKCTGTPRHYFPRPRVRVGQPCPKRPECKVPGGGVSTIQPA